MDFATALETVKGLEGGDAIIEAITAEVSKKNTEAKSLRDRLKAYDGVDPAKHRSLMEALTAQEIDLESDIAEQLAALKAAKASGDITGTKLAQLESRLVKLTKDLETKEAEKAEIEKRATRDKVASLLAGKFSESVQNPDIALDYHLGKGTFSLNENGQIVYKKGDDIIEGGPDEVIKRYLLDNPTQARNAQKPGGGTPPAGSRAAGNSVKKSEFDAMQPKARAEYIAGGGAVID